MPVFNPFDYTSLADVVRGHDSYLNQQVLQPFVSRLQPLLAGLRSEFAVLRRLFLEREPEPIPTSSPAEQFYLESNNKDLNSSLRRFYGNAVQSRGLHIRMRSARTKEEHIHFAMQLDHPNATIAGVLEADWQHVFTQFAASFEQWGVQNALHRVNDYRVRVMTWIRKLHARVQPLQRELLRLQPSGPRKIAGHVQSVLLYILLELSGYPNPNLAWRFFQGAPIVGDFHSSALKQKEKEGGPLTDAQVFRVAEQSQRAISGVKPVLTEGAQVKAKEKMDKEFKSGSLAGPFEDIYELRDKLQKYIRETAGFETFVVDLEWLVISPQFTIAELHAYEEEVSETQESESMQPELSPETVNMTRVTPTAPSATATSSADPDEPSEATSMAELLYKVRNIFNAKKGPNLLSHSYSTYVPNTHGDVSVIILTWITILIQHGFGYTLLGWPADYAAAYRQMPIQVLHSLFACTCYWDYHAKPPRRRFGFYKSLPFGSSLAPAGWGELVVGLACIMARILLVIITHCVDDVANFEPEQIVASAREAFLELNQLLGLSLDMQKSLTPRPEFIYLGLQLILPSSINRCDLRLQVPEARRLKLLRMCHAFLQSECLTTGDASSMRGRLYFYAAWFQEARAYLAELAARQYSPHGITKLTRELRAAFEYFIRMLQMDQFRAGIRPAHIFLNRERAWLYTDGAKKEAGWRPGYPYAFKGIGGIAFPSIHATPLWYGEQIDPTLHAFDHIAAIEMFAVLRALRLFGEALRGKALFMFIDNTPAVGCLLRRSSSVSERPPRVGVKRPASSGPVTPQQEFDELPDTLKREMKELASQIWCLITQLDIIVWIEYIWTEVNPADLPSRGEFPPLWGLRLGGGFQEWVR